MPITASIDICNVIIISYGNPSIVNSEKSNNGNVI